MTAVVVPVITTTTTTRTTTTTITNTGTDMLGGRQTFLGVAVSLVDGKDGKALHLHLRAGKSAQVLGTGLGKTAILYKRQSDITFEHLQELLEALLEERLNVFAEHLVVWHEKGAEEPATPEGNAMLQRDPKAARLLVLIAL